ncbi:MAG: hypothetical protein QXG00_05365 [Candidatus Woesearchaeota archaeon]
MVFFTLKEIFDALLMSFVVGFIFSGVFTPVRLHRTPDDIINEYIENPKVKKSKLKSVSFSNLFKGSWFRDILFASMVVAPAIVLHELGHKIVALGFGMQATFHAAYEWLGVGIILKIIGFPFIFFVPAYVSIFGGNNLSFGLTALAGPLINLILYLISLIIMKFGKLNNKQRYFFALTRRINIILFFFNMLPIPGFDGFQVYTNLYRAFF